MHWPSTCADIGAHPLEDPMDRALTSDSDTVIDVTPPDAVLLPPPTAWEPESDDAWLASMSDDQPRTSLYLDSYGREVRVTHPGLIPPAAITFHDGVPAAAVEFIWKGDD